jgi:hypothetical protein
MAFVLPDSDLPSLADQIAVNTEDVPAEIGADLIGKPPRRKRRAVPAPPISESSV